MLLYTFLIGCGEKTEDTSVDSSEETQDIQETAAEQTEEGESVEESEFSYVDTTEEYIAVYCSDFALECGLYSSQTTCEEEIMGDWFSTCTVTDQAKLLECVEWIAAFPCDGEGWIDACDEWFTCE